MYDAIVVGARCAGAPTAMLLARKGYRVLLADRAAFPSDSISTHFIRQPGVALLRRWGLLDRVVASNCPPIVAISHDLGGDLLTGSATPAGEVAAAYGPRRTVLDAILVNAAVEAGVELRESFSVQGLLTEGDRVVGIRGRAHGGAPVTERARVVIGADGRHSVVAQCVGAPAYHVRPPLACYYYSYWSGVPDDGLEISSCYGRVILAFPTNDGLTCVIAGWQHRAFHEVRADIAGHFNVAVGLIPELAARIAAGRREARFVGTGDLPNFFRKPFGPGWALVGDAGYHKDPYLAQGISDAFHGAEMLAEALDAGFAEHQPLDEALAGYQRRRDEAMLPIYDLNCRLAALDPPSPEQIQLRAALRDNPEETSRYFGVTAGTVPVGEFFAPENIRRIIGAAARREPVAAAGAARAMPG